MTERGGEGVTNGLEFMTPLMSNFIYENYLTKNVNISEENCRVTT